MRRSGVTLIELLVAAAVATLFLVVAWEALIVQEKARSAGEAQANKVIRQAEVLETLLRDLRSASRVEDAGDGSFAIYRFHPGAGGRLEEHLVLWSRAEDSRLRRELEDGTVRVYDLTETLDPGQTLELRVEALPDVLFVP